MQYTLFVGGVTGSGKTTICTKIATMMNGRGRVVHVGGIACGLASAHALATESIEEASSLALDECQRLVVEYIAGIQHLEPANAIFILDGHFVLGGVGRPPYFLPNWFFTRLAVKSLILCAPSATEIRARIRADSERQRPAAIVQSLERYMAIEAESAQVIGQQCSIPLTIIRGCEQMQLELFTHLLD